MITRLPGEATDPRRRGQDHGRRNAAAVRANVAEFLAAAERAGWDRDDLVRAGTDMAARLSKAERTELTAIADAAGIDRSAHLAFVLTGHVVVPEECTVAAAVGAASSTGWTALLKNSDKIGGRSFVGPGYDSFKEINVVVDLRTEDGVRIVGVAAAGSTGLKMGVNDAGVAAASNIVRTVELRNRAPALEDLRALDRGRLLRHGLGMRSAWDATVWAMAAIEETPMATPGNVHFAAADRAFVIEGSYDRVALERVRDRVVIRANRFQLLDDLNDPDDISSVARYRRARELLDPQAGSITVGDLRSLSRDHANGPGLASICRHSQDHEDETSLSAMVAALDGNDPGRSYVEFALGKPCWTWDSPQGVLAMTLDDPAAVTPTFLEGDAWRRHYHEDPR